MKFSKNNNIKQKLLMANQNYISGYSIFFQN